MSTADPEPDVAYESPHRLRWVAPLMLGVCLGVILGGAGVLVFMLAGGGGSSQTVAEQFQPQQVIANLPGGTSLSVQSDTSSPLGRASRRTSGGVHRRITFTGTFPDHRSAQNAGQQMQAQIDAELNRRSAWASSGSSGTGSSGDQLRPSFRCYAESGYYTRDGRQGTYDFDYRAVGNTVEATLILTEVR